MVSQFIITAETAHQLEARKTDLEREMGRLREEHALVCKQLEAVPLFLGMVNGQEPAAETEQADGDGTPTADAEAVSVPVGVRFVLQEGKRLTALEIREALKSIGVRKLGIGNSYLYTTLKRLQDRGKIQKVRGKYQLPPGVLYTFMPKDERDVMP